LVGRGGEVATEVAQVVFDRAEGLALREVGETLGHLPQPGLGVAAEEDEEGLDAGLTVIGGLRRSGSGRV
jgi:hypothetical protein